jgi:hypothetical protein
VAEAYLVDAVRSPVGRRGGGLAGVHPADMGAHVLRALVERTGVDPAAVEDVIFGCLDNIGAQAGDIARTSALAAGLPETVPGVTLDRQCGSAQPVSPVSPVCRTPPAPATSVATWPSTRSPASNCPPAPRVSWPAAARR